MYKLIYRKNDKKLIVDAEPGEQHHFLLENPTMFVI